MQVTLSSSHAKEARDDGGHDGKRGGEVVEGNEAEEKILLRVGVLEVRHGGSRALYHS